MSAEQDEMWLELPSGMEHITRYNTELYRYLGESALLGDHSNYNHIEIVQEDEEGAIESCAIIFADNDNYEDVSRFMLRWNYPQHFNLASGSKFVEYAFDVTHGIDPEAEDVTFPESWMEGEDGTA